VTWFRSSLARRSGAFARELLNHALRTELLTEHNGTANTVKASTLRPPSRIA
jgi:hypothetical protein